MFAKAHIFYIYRVKAMLRNVLNIAVVPVECSYLHMFPADSRISQRDTPVKGLWQRLAWLTGTGLALSTAADSQSVARLNQEVHELFY